MSRIQMEQILDLPLAERVELAASQREELERRWKAFEQRPDEGEPWEDVKRSLSAE